MVYFLQIIVWKVDWEHVAPLLNSPEGNHAHGSSSDFKCFKLQDQQHTAVNLFRLVGHEGSIFRIEWSSCGSKLVSVSDDRRWISFQVLSSFFLLLSWSDSMHHVLVSHSARIWEVHAEYWKDSDSIEEVGSSVLYGHSARVWDCCLTDSVSLVISSTLMWCSFLVFTMIRSSDPIIFFKMV